MGAVGIHLTDHVVILIKPPPETSDIRCTQSLFTLAVQDMDMGIIGCHLVGKITGAIGAIVIDDQDVYAVRLCFAQTAHDEGQIILFVVRRDDDQRVVARLSQR